MLTIKNEPNCIQWSLDKNTTFCGQLESINDKADRFLISGLKDKIIELQGKIIHGHDNLIVVSENRLIRFCRTC